MANAAKISADGSVTTHSDVTDAGSGAIITALERNKLSSIEAGADYLRKDTSLTSTVYITVNDADFVLRDTTDTTTNYLWRDHSANALYLGTANAVPTTRADMTTFGGDIYWHSGNLIPSVIASSDTIVQRNPSGYIYANYFNTSPNDVSTSITKVCAETNDDGFK